MLSDSTRRKLHFAVRKVLAQIRHPSETDSTWHEDPYCKVCGRVIMLSNRQTMQPLCNKCARRLGFPAAEGSDKRIGHLTSSGDS